MDKWLPLLLQLLPIALGVGIVSLYFSRLMKVITELRDLMTVILAAFADGIITPEETQKIIKESKDIVTAAKILFAKSDKEADVTKPPE